MTRDELLTLIRTDEGVREAIRDAVWNQPVAADWRPLSGDVIEAVQSAEDRDELLDTASEDADDRTSLMLSMMGEMMSDGVVNDEEEEA